jgi:putative NADPH-quinone reductase
LAAKSLPFGFGGRLAGMVDASCEAMAAQVRRIVVIQGHPDPQRSHFCHALAAAYEKGALEEGHRVDVIDIARIDVPFLRMRSDLDQEAAPAVRQAQQTLLECDHIVLIHPIWNGGAPALLRAFMEQAFRPSFIFPDTKPGEPLGFSSVFRQRKALKGKTARVVATMQMPAFIYRWLFRPHQEASALRLGGARVRETLIGLVESPKSSRRAGWLKQMHRLGEAAQ